MHRLILLRHGEAEREAASRDDFDRRLAARGRAESEEMGRTLADLGLVPDLALVSPSARTRETWAALEPSFPGAQARFEDALYHCEAEGIRQLAEAAGAAAEVVMVVGHNPGLHELALRLMTESATPVMALERARRHFPTAAAAAFLIDGAGRAAFDGLFLPR